MTPHQHTTLADRGSQWYRPRPTIRPADWAERNIILPASEERGRGPLTWRGREFCIDVVNDWASTDVNDIVCCFGSQIGKTVMLMSGLAYLIALDPRGVIWCMPNDTLARSFSGKRWMALVEATPALASMIPTGQDRFDWGKSEQELGGALINFVGAGSRINLSSRPKAVAICDETDKFPLELQGEAGAVNLVEQRVKDSARPLRIKVSSPSTTDGPIWIEFLKGTQSRFEVPCPHCSSGIFLAWNKGATVLPMTGREAWAEWDKEAKRSDGSWDYDRVRSSAHWVCPHCQGHVHDHHKTAAVRAGKWVATNPNAPASFVSRHLPSLYACAPSTSLGALAQKFLELQRSLDGIQGFINGDLAEPWESQTDKTQRTEIILESGSDATKPVADTVVTILSVDVQRSSPCFYWIAREFAGNGEGHSRRVGVGTCEEWEQIADIQLKYGVENHRVVIDSGDGVRTEEVYRECCRRGKLVQMRGKRPLMVGWRPAKGAPGDARWKDEKTGQARLWGNIAASLPHADFELRLFQFAGPAWKDALSNLRKGPDHSAGIRWEVLADPEHDQEYWRHLDAKTKKSFHHARTGREVFEWSKRSKNRPDHWDDCEVQCLAFAASIRLVPWARQNPKGTEL